jgi:predicted Zn-dependent peptidase
MYSVTKLPNGLTIATASMPYMASVSLGVWVGIGSRFEPENYAGVSHFIEHMLFKGTKSRSARKISEDIEAIGGSSNAFTSEENTCFYSRAPATKVSIVLDVLMDMYLNSVFEKNEIQKEREVIAEEIAIFENQPQLYIEELLNSVLWQGSSLARSITGTIKSIKKINRQVMLDFKNKYYVAPNTIIVAAGAIEHSRFVNLCKKYSNKFNRGTPPEYTPVLHTQTKPRFKVCSRKTDQCHIALGFVTCSRHNPLHHSVKILNALVGENTSSRLFQSLREDKALVYSIGSTASFYEDTGDITITATLDNQKLTRVLSNIFTELKQFVRKAPSKKELSNAIDYLAGQIDLGLENTENQQNWVGESLLNFKRIITPKEIKDHLLQITPSTIQKIAQTFFHPSRLNIAIIGPFKQNLPLTRLLEKL